MNSIRSSESGRKPRGRPSHDDSLALRTTILREALEEFLARGFEGANIDAIARRAGVGRATIYRQYGGKDSLFRAAVENRNAALIADLRAVTSQQKPPEVVLLEIIERIYEALTSAETLAIVRLSVAEAGRFPDICAAIWEAETREILAPVVEYLGRLKTDGILDLGDPPDAAYHLINLACGGLRFLLNKPLPRGKARPRWAQSVLQMILPALRHQRAPRRR